MAEENLAPRIARLERQFADLERLLTLGALGGGDAEATLQRHSALLGMLVGDDVLGNILTGPFPGADSASALIRDDTESYYPSGSAGAWPAWSSLSMTGNVIHAVPFYMPKRPNFVFNIGIRVTQANAGKNARLAIYDDGEGGLPSGKMYPNNLIKDIGTVSVASVGVKTLAVNESLPRGLYWLTLLTDASTLKTYGVQTAAGAWPILGVEGFDFSLPMFGWWKTGFAYGVMPAVFPNDGVKGDVEPLIFLSFKSGGWS